MILTGIESINKRNPGPGVHTPLGLVFSKVNAIIKYSIKKSNVLSSGLIFIMSF